MLQLNLQSTRGISTRNGIKVIVHGRAGRGKTRLCATCPSPVVLSAESGLLSLAQYDLPYFEIRSIKDLKDAYQWARTSSQAKQFQTICIDSITEVAEVLLASAKVGKKDPRQAYGEMIEEMTKVVKDFRDLPFFNVYMATKTERQKDESTGIIFTGPAMPGKKMGEAMPYLPDEIFYIDVNDNPYYHYLRCKPSFGIEAKDRSGVLNEIEEPHLGKIFDKIARASSNSPV